MKWTDRQREAIDARDCNLLVAAAAGSGKTAVLVERIVSLVRDGLSVDKLLVVTFTRAAAAEMREKILAAFQSAADAGGAWAGRFAEQTALVERAQISTLHTFCAALLRAHFEVAGIDPTFRVADEREVLPLRELALREALSAGYAAGGDDFDALADRWSDGQIREQVSNLYRFLLAQPAPWDWLEKAIAAYDAGEGALEGSPWTIAMLEGARTLLASAQASFAQAETLCAQPGGCGEYLDVLAADQALIASLRKVSHQGYEALRLALQTAAFHTLPRKANECDLEMKERAKSLRDAGKKAIQSLAKELFAVPLAEHREDLRAQIPQLRALAALAHALDERYATKKQARNLLDFADLEHKALESVRQQVVADALRAQYDAIFVDEYQDSSVIQEELIQRIARKDNVFLVGDVKQSIYRFRQAEPALFLRKLGSYQATEGARDRRIDLNRNFRSRANVLEAVNDVFAYAMRKEETEIPYDEDARLYPGRQDPADAPDPGVELHLVELASSGGKEAAHDDLRTGGDADGAEEGMSEEGAQGATNAEGYWWNQNAKPADALTQQALIAVERIRALIDTPLWDAKKQTSRPLRYRDIVILLQVAKNVAQSVQKVLEEHGVPVFSDAGDAFFAMPEVLIVIDLLRVIDNPLNDTSLLGALHGPAAHIGNDALLAIRNAYENSDAPYYEAVLSYAQRADGLAGRLRAFLDMMTSLRLHAKAGTLEALIWRVYDLTGCYARAGALPGGHVRQANLRMLAERAAVFEQRQEGGLAAFLWEAEQLRARGDNLTAKALSESEDVVRIMTMHMSKGLEFPVVICIDLDRNFVRKGGAGPMLDCHATQGLALRMIDPVLRTRYATLPCEALRFVRRKEALADATRLLYVAMTRAMDRLILIAPAARRGHNLAERLERWQAVPRGTLLSEAQTMLDFLLPVVALDDCAANKTNPSFAGAKWMMLVRGSMATEKRRETEAEEWIEKMWSVAKQGRNEEIIGKLSWTMPIVPDDAARLKTTVSALLRREQGEEAYEPPVPWPLFLEASGATGMALRTLSGAARGSAFHAAMRGLDLAALRGRSGASLIESIDAQLDALVSAERLRPTERLVVRAEDVAAFFADDMGRRMLASDTVRREWAFNLRMEEGGAARLVQGVLDCCFLEHFSDGEAWALVDYKTDAERDQDVVLARYLPQISLYAQALLRITGKPVRSASLYLTKKARSYPYDISAI